MALVWVEEWAETVLSALLVQLVVEQDVVGALAVMFALADSLLVHHLVHQDEGASLS